MQLFKLTSSKEFLDIKAGIESEFSLEDVHDMTPTYSQMHHTDSQSEDRSVIWTVWRNN